MTAAVDQTISKTLDLSPEDAIARVKVALGDEGFGILTEIDVAATLHEKLGATLAPYSILGACNPALALRALEADPEVGLMLPCNVIVYERDGRSVIVTSDPSTRLRSSGNPALTKLAEEAAERLNRAFEAL